jgi:tetraacyldisaccharide 4'-kinase
MSLSNRIIVLINRMLMHIWYDKNFWQLLLIPFSAAYKMICWCRRLAFRKGIFRTYRPPVPVLVVGNISVGGTGKTPLSIWLALKLLAYGYRPGIVCGGYGGKADFWPQQVRPDSDWTVVGDEAILIARQVGSIPVAVGPTRSNSVEAVVAKHDVDIIVSDDGLQHYALERDIEIVVVDGVRRLGNGHCLPAGPLRESPARLKDIDLIVCKGIASRGEYPMKLTAHCLRSVNRPEIQVEVADFSQRIVHAVAGIGNPNSFFTLLRSLGFELHEHVFPDHYALTAEDVTFGDGLPVIMTEKDSVKCEVFDHEDIWCLPVRAELSDIFEGRLKALLQGVADG